MVILKVLLPFLLPGNRRASSEGTCPGDSGGPLLIDEYMDGEFTTVQNGVLHGSLRKCSNQKYPAIFSRLSHPDIHNWLFSNLFAVSESKYLLLWEHSHIKKNHIYLRASRIFDTLQCTLARNNLLCPLNWGAQVSLKIS